MEWLLETFYVKSYYRIIEIRILRILRDFNTLLRTTQRKFQSDYIFLLKNLTSLQMKWFCVPKKMRTCSKLSPDKLLIRHLSTGQITFELIVNGNACWKISDLTKSFSNDVGKGQTPCCQAARTSLGNILFLVE